MTRSSTFSIVPVAPATPSETHNRHVPAIGSPVHRGERGLVGRGRSRRDELSEGAAVVAARLVERVVDDRSGVGDRAAARVAKTMRVPAGTGVPPPALAINTTAVPAGDCSTTRRSSGRECSKNSVTLTSPTSAAGDTVVRSKSIG